MCFIFPDEGFLTSLLLLFHQKIHQKIKYSPDKKAVLPEAYKILEKYGFPA